MLVILHSEYLATKLTLLVFLVQFMQILGSGFDHYASEPFIIASTKFSDMKIGYYNFILLVANTKLVPKIILVDLNASR